MVFWRSNRESSYFRGLIYPSHLHPFILPLYFHIHILKCTIRLLASLKNNYIWFLKSNAQFLGCLSYCLPFFKEMEDATETGNRTSRQRTLVAHSGVGCDRDRDSSPVDHGPCPRWPSSGRAPRDIPQPQLSAGHVIRVLGLSVMRF